MVREYIVKVTDEVNPDAFQRFENYWSPEQEIVRCKDCKNAVVYDGNEVICTHIDSNGNDKHSIDWFCADGEKDGKSD